MIYAKILFISLMIFVGTLFWFYFNKQNNQVPDVQFRKEASAPAVKKVITTPKSAKGTEIKSQKLSQASKIEQINYEVPELHSNEMLNLINSYRKSKGLWEFSQSDELCVLAQKRADYLIANDMAEAKVSVPGNHQGLYDQAKNYSGTWVGENFIANPYNNKNAIGAWQNSPPHNDILLSTKAIRDDQLKESLKDITKACILIKIEQQNSMVVLLVGDR